MDTTSLASYKKHPNSYKGRRCKDLSIKEAAYLAGLFDGEGSVGITRRLRPKKGQATPSYGIILSITNTHEGVLRWVCETTGLGAVYCHFLSDGIRKDSFRWQANGKWHVGRFLEQMLPFLIIKKARVALLLSSMNSLPLVEKEFLSMNKRGA